MPVLKKSCSKRAAEIDDVKFAATLSCGEQHTGEHGPCIDDFVEGYSIALVGSFTAFNRLNRVFNLSRNVRRGVPPYRLLQLGKRPFYLRKTYASQLIRCGSQTRTEST